MNAQTPTLVIRHATPDTGEPSLDALRFEPAFLDVAPGRLRPPVLPGCGPRELAHLGHHICRTPRDLATHTRRILLAHALRDADETFAALADLFAALGDVGTALRRTLLQRTAGILSTDHRRALEAMLTRAPTVDEMLAVPRARLSSPLPPAPVVRRIARAVVTEDADPLAEANEYLEHGQVDEARTLLEQAIAEQPDTIALHRALLDIHRHARDADAIAEMHRRHGNADDEVSVLWRTAARASTRPTGDE